MRRNGGRFGVVALAIALLVGSAACSGAERPSGASAPNDTDAVRLNELQYIGTHNSYHRRPAPEVMTFLRNVVNNAPDLRSRFGDPDSLDYEHAPLPAQLAAGIRTFELDVVDDPTGGRFSSPALVSKGFVQLADPDVPAGLDRPGFKVVHIPDIDWRSTCGTLAACLGELRAFSDAHPKHLPIIVNMELKSEGLPAELGGTEVLPIDAAALTRFDNEVRSVLGDRLLTPDDVRGDAPDLPTALRTRGWPTVDSTRGRIMLFLDNEGLRDRYLDGHPRLERRTMFTSSGFPDSGSSNAGSSNAGSSNAGSPNAAGSSGVPADAAVLKVNDPTDPRIPDLVAQGFLVRTRADSDVVTVRRDRAAARSAADAALATGAQLVHTDFPVGAADGGYSVEFPTPVQVRCSPVRPVAVPAAPTCDGSRLTE